MSWEGAAQVICANGHYAVEDGLYFDPRYCHCVICGADAKYWRLVDETNGTDENDIRTQFAGINIIHSYDEWHYDHHGNRYATLHHLYAPVMPKFWQVFDRKTHDSTDDSY